MHFFYKLVIKSSLSETVRLSWTSEIRNWQTSGENKIRFEQILFLPYYKYGGENSKDFLAFILTM